MSSVSWVLAQARAGYPRTTVSAAEQAHLYERYGWSWAYWAFREWDVMNIERTGDAADKVNRSDTPLLRLFKTYFTKDKQFLSGE